MSSQLTLPVIDLTQTNKNHKTGWNDVKSEHSIMSKSYKKGQDKFIDLNAIALQDRAFCDLTYDEYSIAHLNPLETKRFKNLEAYPHGFETDQDVLSWVCAMMTESTLGNMLIQHFEENNWLISLNDTDNGGYYINLAEKTLEIDSFGLDSATLGRSSLFRNTILINFSRAIRDIWHENQNYNFMDEYQPEVAMLLERVRYADTDSVAIMIAYELRNAGYKELWRHVLGTEDADMAQVLLNVSDMYPTSLYNGMALAHIFRQWYADPSRINAVDHLFLETMDDVLQDKEFIMGSKEALPEIIEAMSQIGREAQYLKGVAETVLRDPYFCKLEDPINTAHLFQITYDIKVIMREGVPFRDATLARKIFPSC